MNLSATEIAQALGVTRQAVNKAARLGRIKREGDGKFDLDGVKRAWSQNCDVRQQTRSNGKRKPSHAERSDRNTDPENRSQAEATRQREWEKLKRERLLNQKLEGTLVDAEQVKSETEARFRADAEALLNWPATLSAILAAELGVDERTLHAALDRGVRQFMRERSMVPADA